jgi:hypothetical protein
MAEEIITEDVVPVEAVVTPDPEPKPKQKPNPYTKKVYDNLLEEYGQDNLPTYEIFSEKIKDPKYRYAVHTNLLDLYGANNVPDFKGFNDSLDVVIPEKKNLVATGGDGYVPLESALGSIPKTETFDKNANPAVLARQAFELKQPEVKSEVALDMSGMPVESNADYNPDKIKIASDIEKHLDEQGFPKDFRESLQRVRNLKNKNYIDPDGGPYGNDDAIVAAYKEDPDFFTKRIHRDLWQENLAQNFNDLANKFTNIDGVENEAKNDKDYSEIGEKLNIIANSIFDLNQTLENRQFYIKQASDAIKQYIRDPKEQQQALQDLAISTSGSFGTLEDYTDKRLKPIGNLNEWQSMGLNYLDRMDAKTAEYYRKFLDVNPEDFKSSYEQAGYEQQRKNLEETGLQLFINNAQQELNQLSKKAKQQGNVLDEEDLNTYNNLSQRLKEATDRLNTLPDLYPYAKDVDTYQIAQELTDNGNSIVGNAARKLKGGLLNIGGTIANLGADILGSKETQRRMALKTLGFSTESEIESMPTRAQSAPARPKITIDKDLQMQIDKVNKDNTLTKDQKTEKVDLLLRRNQGKYQISTADTSWNLSATAIASTVLNTAADLAPFIITMALTEGAAAGVPALLPRGLSSFAKMYGNVLLTSYNQELANEMKNKNPEAEKDAFANVLVNTLAFEVAGKGGTFIKGIRENAAKAGGRVSDLISKLSDEQILKAAKNQNTTLKGFLNNAKEVLPKKAAEGVKSALGFESVMLGKDVLEGKEITSEDLKQHALNALSFSILNTIGGAGLEMVNLNSKNKADLYNAAVHKDEVLYELNKAKANGKMTQDAYNQAKQNVESAAKVLEKTPMVDENGKKLTEKQSIELMSLKIKDQLMQDNMKKDLPEKLKEKMTQDWLKNQEKINDIVKGNFYEETGKPFSGLEEKVNKRKLEEEKTKDVKPVEEVPEKIDLSEFINSKTNKPVEEVEPVEVKEEVKPTEKDKRISELETLISNDDATFAETGQRPLLKEARDAVKKELEFLYAEKKGKVEPYEKLEGQQSEAPIEDIVSVESFADRVAKGEIMTKPEDLQFYDNNKAEIEKVLRAKAEEAKPVEEAKQTDKITEIIPEVTIEGNRKEDTGYSVHSGEKENRVGDIRQDANEARAAGKDFFTKETEKGDKKIFTLVDTTVSDAVGRSGFKAVSIAVPKGSKMEIKDVMPSLEAAMRGEEVPSIKIAPEVTPISEVKEFKLGYAPFREGKITDVSQADKAFQNKAYQSWKKMANEFAKNIGLEVVSDPNTVGKYGATSELGEASSTPTVRGTDAQVELFAALMGTLAPEGQHSVMINKYDLNGKDHEHVFTFNSKEAAQDFYKNAGKYGVQDLSLTPGNNSVMFITGADKGFNTKIIDIYGKQITGHEQNRINTRFLSQGEYSRILNEQGDKIGGQYPQEYRENIANAIKLAKERERRFGSDYDKKSEQAQIEAKEATKNYIDTNKEALGLPETEETAVKKIDTALAKEIKDAYDALPVDDSKNPEVAAAYNKAVEEIDKQFQYLTKDLGIKVEFIKDDPYKNSEEMFEDVINNKRLKVYQGGEPHPFLGDSSKDSSGFTANEKLRAVHDIFGHFVNRNQFGKIGEEAAWVDHSKMFSPEAQRAISTETRGQNSWVNFSGVNDVAIEKMKQGNDLIKEGKITEGNKLIAEGQAEFKFAEQKVALLPKELTDWYKYTEKGKAPETKVKIEEPVIEEEKPAKTPQEVKISKQALGENYNFSKEFDVRGGDVVATDVLNDLNKSAKENNVDLKTQISTEVSAMFNGNVEPTEHNIITAGAHLLNLDKKIETAQNQKNLAEIENLTEQREQVLSVLRTLGNKAGRNLGLFNLVFKDVDASEIKVTRDRLKNILNVSEVPETISELDKSNLTAEQKKTIRPYVEKIEQTKAQFNKLEKDVNASIAIINDKEINAALDKARAEGKKEGFEEGLKSASNEVKQKKSKQLKDLASKIRISNEYDNFLKGSDGKQIEKMGVDFGNYKEMVANVLDAVAKAVELGENLNEALRKAIDKFKDVDKAKLIKDVKTIISKSQLPDRQKTINDLSKIAKAENARNITSEIVKKGLVKDIVNSYLGEDMTNDQVLDAATKDLKSILPSVTKEDVADAYAERNQFKKQTKAKIEDEINQKKADVRRLAVKEARLSALEAADTYHAEESKEKKKAIRSEYESELDKKIKSLLSQKSDIQKSQKISKSPKTEQDKINEINREIEYVKTTKSVYEQAIKDPKKASDALIAAREERDKTYASLGLKLEKNAKAPILIERDYQEALSQIERSGLSDREKADRIDELKAQRDLDLQGTKQGVVSSLSDDINNFVKYNVENADLNNTLRSLLKDLTPTGEKLDDQINKAYNKLNKLAKDESLTKEQRQGIKEIITDLENNNQLTSDELSSKRLKKQWENEIRTAETNIASGNFTKIPSTTYDFRRNDELVRLNKARENKSGQFNRLVADAKEKTRTKTEKALDLSTKFLVSGIHTTAKVAEAGSVKPFMDSMVDLTAGRLASYITGAPYTSLYSVKKGFKTFAAFKNKEAATQYIEKLKNDRDVALENLQNAHESGSESDIKKADKEFKKADLEYAVSTLYNSIESNSLNSFWQYLKHGATDYDVSIGKSTKKDISDYRSFLGKTGYVLDGWIRMHGALKSTLSARPEMMKVFSQTLKDFQRRGMELNPENISTAMVLAADAYEAGRLTNKTALSKIISRGKGSEKSKELRYLTKALMPVSTIAVNLAKRGVDYTTLGAEGFVRLANETRKGMKLNEVEGKTYDSMIKAIKDGWSKIPLKERAYINGVIGRGLFGSGMMLATAYGLASGNVKYGGTYEDQKKRKIMGSDGEQLKAGEWEFFGERLPKAASLFLNHLPEFLAVSLVADNYQINQQGGSAGDKFETTIDELEARLPFQTLAGILVPGKRVNTVLDRFTRIPIAAEVGGFFDEKGEFRDKKDVMNRIRANVGLGAFNPTKQQQKQIDLIWNSVKKTPDSLQTPEFKAKINNAIDLIKNVDFKEVETKKAIEEAMKKAKENKEK